MHAAHGSPAETGDPLGELAARLRAGTPWSALKERAAAALEPLDPVDREQAIATLAKASGTGKRAIRKELEPFLDRADPADPADLADPEGDEPPPEPADDDDRPMTVPARPGTRCFWKPWRFQGEPAGSTRQPGIWRVTVSNRDGAKAYHVAGPARVVATVAGPDGTDHGALIEFRPAAADGRPRVQVIVDHATRVADPRAVGALLASRGLLVLDAVELARFLAYPPRERRAVLAKRAGWLTAGERRVFVTRSGAIVGDLEAVPGPELTAPGPRGELADWRLRIAAVAVGNPPLAFAIGLALAGPLVRLLDRPNTGAVLIGSSSTGKTSIAYAAASVWGPDPAGNLARTWNGTANGLAAAAAEANDTCFVLDEMGAADAFAVQRIIFDLAGEAGRSRARRDGTAAPAASWRGTFLATSERAVEDVAGRRLPEGARGRLVELRVDHFRHGCFDALHGLGSGAAFADAVRDAARECHGTAGPAFVAHLREADLEDLKRRHRRLEEELGPTEAGLDARVRSGLALAALAGELATEADVLPWTQGEATRAAQWAYARWRGEAEPSERERICHAIRDFVDRCGQSRFVPPNDRDAAARVPSLAGWRTDTGDFWFNQSGIKEALTGFDLRRACCELAAVGWLRQEDQGRFTCRRRIFDGRQVRVYVIRPADDD